MRNVVGSLLILVGAGLVLATAEATEVGQRGSWQRMEFRGLETLDAESIRASLAIDLDWQIAACATAPLDALVVTTRERLAEGFRYSGYPEAKVEVEFDAKEDRLVVTVDEGRHLTAGKVSLSAPEWVDHQRLKQSIATGTDRSAWKMQWNRQDAAPLISPRKAKASLAGERVPLHESTQLDLRRALRTACAEQGLLLGESQIGIELQHKGTTVDLQILLPQDAPQSHFNTVQVLGLTRHSAEEVMEYLEIAPGMPFDAETVDQVCRKLRESCRFWTFEVTVQLAVPEEGGRYVVEEPEAHLVVDVVEYEEVPKLGEALSEVDQALLRAANWANEYVRSGAPSEQDLVLDLRGHLGEFAGEAQLCLAPTEGVAVSWKGSAGDREVDETLRSERGRLTLLGWHQKGCFSFEGLRLNPSLHITPSSRDKDKYVKSFKLGLGLKLAGEGEDTEPLFELDIEPVALIEMVRDTQPRREIKAEEVILATTAMRLVIERQTGRIREVTFHQPAGEGIGGTLRADFRPQQYARNLAEAMERSQGLPRHQYSLVPAKERSEAKEGREFHIPPTAPAEESVLTALVWIRCADEWLPRGSWAWVMMRERQFKQLNHLLTADQQLIRAEEFLKKLMHSEETGPLGYYFLAKTYTGAPTYSRYFAGRGLTALRERRLADDLLLLENEKLLLAQFVNQLLCDCENIEVSPLWSVYVVLLPPEIEQPLYRLFARKEVLPEENVGGALAGTLMEVWDDHLEQAVEKELMRLAEAPPASAAKAKVATKSNPKQPDDKAAPPPAPDGGLFDGSENGDLWKALD